jgi:hypothetical protein
MKGEAFPFSYFLMRNWTSPFLSGRDTGVYGRIMGFPLSPTRAAGSGDLTTTQDATGSKVAVPSGRANVNLETKLDTIPRISIGKTCLVVLWLYGSIFLRGKSTNFSLSSAGMRAARAFEEFASAHCKYAYAPSPVTPARPRTKGTFEAFRGLPALSAKARRPEAS